MCLPEWWVAVHSCRWQICRAKQAMCWTMATYISLRYQYLFPFVYTYKMLPALIKPHGMMRASTAKEME
jgi:hypothetical protein